MERFFLKNKVGRCLLGRCALPYEVKDRFNSDRGSIYEFSVTYRSNYGQKNNKTSFCLSYDEIDGDLLIEQTSSEKDLPLYLVQKRKQQTFWMTNGRHYKLVKPNKHFLKQFDSNIFFKKGVMEINLFFTPINASAKRNKQVQLFAYPSIINQREYLVIEVDGIPAHLGMKKIKKGNVYEARN